MLKRVVDVALSSVALIVLAPIMLVIAIAVLVDSGLPILFRQDRVGFQFRIFRIVKFRTMYVQNGGSLVTISGDKRVTRVGRLLRTAKLDEIPQFWNVLCGDMSLVGPRPEVPQYVALFRDRYTEILSVRPGITDLASIEFRNEEAILQDCNDPLRAYEEQILPAKLDLAEKYIRTRSVLGDLLILFHTAMRLI